MRHMRKVVPADAAAAFLGRGPELHHAPAHTKDWSWSSLLEIKDFEDLTPIISVLLLLIVIFVWSHAQWSASGARKEKSAKQSTKAAASPALPAPAAAAAAPQPGVSAAAKPRPRKSLAWFGALAGASALLLVLQLVLGVYSGSLTLLADMGHAAGDTVTYIAAYVVERAKMDLTSRKGAPATASRMDMLGGCTSALLVAGVSINAMVDAVQRLRSAAPEKEGEDVRMIGSAILVFALVSLAVNMSLLAYRFKEESAPEVSDTSPSAAAPPPAIAVPSSSDDAEAGDATPPPPAAHAGRRPPRRSPKGQASPAAPLLSSTVEGAVPAGVPPADAPASPTKWLHAAFHPGCDGCDDDSCNEGQAQAPGATSESKEREKNLNLYGATLHLATDVIRSFIVLVTGLLLKANIVTDVARTDAVCALIVGVCVLIGSAAFFYAPLVQFFSREGAKA